MGELRQSLLFLEGGVIQILRTPFDVLAYCPDLILCYKRDLDLVVRRRDIETFEFSDGFATLLETEGFPVFIGVAIDMEFAFLLRPLLLLEVR